MNYPLPGLTAAGSGAKFPMTSGRYTPPFSLPAYGVSPPVHRPTSELPRRTLSSPGPSDPVPARCRPLAPSLRNLFSWVTLSGRPVHEPRINQILEGPRRNPLAIQPGGRVAGDQPRAPPGGVGVLDPARGRGPRDGPDGAGPRRQPGGLAPERLQGGPGPVPPSRRAHPGLDRGAQLRPGAHRAVALPEVRPADPERQGADVCLSQLRPHRRRA